jgi:hypothetical protein
MPFVAADIHNSLTGRAASLHHHVPNPRSIADAVGRVRIPEFPCSASVAADGDAAGGPDEDIVGGIRAYTDAKS